MTPAQPYDPDERVDACEQCGRIVPFSYDALRQTDNSLLAFCDERCSRDYRDVHGEPPYGP